MSEDIRVLNQDFLNYIEGSSNGSLTKAASESSKMLRTQLREEGFMRKILPSETITNEELDRNLEHDRPYKIYDMEPNSKGAVTLPFNVSSDMQFFYGRKFAVDFFTIKTPKWNKSIHELRTYEMDLRKVITENSLKDIQTEEDANFIGAVNDIVGTPAGVSSVTGVQQSFEISGGISKSTYPLINRYLIKQRLNNGVYLMNASTAQVFATWNRTEIGGDMAQDLFKDGVKGIKDAVINGVPHIFTIKDELIPDDTVYCFTTPDFLGKNLELEPVTMDVEKREDQIIFGARECIGFSIANALGVVKLKFTA
jgi:hypothetical protein